MVGIDDIHAARDRIAGMVRVTPAKPSPSRSALAGGPVWLKCEHRQDTGAFKLRGAAHAVARLGDVTGVTTASTGNHGRALAHAAGARGLAAVICVSRLMAQNRLDAIAALAAEARVTGDSQDQAFGEARRLQRDQGFALIPPFDHADVIAGQGTLGLEIIAQIPDAAAIAVPLSGGGLLSGVALAAKTLRPDLRIIGISMERGAAMAASLAAGHPVGVPELDTLADSLGGKLCGPVPLVQPSPGIMLDMPGEDCFHFASRDGLLHLLADLGETVTAGQPLAQIWPPDRSGVAPAQITAQRDGILAARHFPGLVQSGDCLAVIATVLDEDP